MHKTEYLISRVNEALQKTYSCEADFKFSVPLPTTPSAVISPKVENPTDFLGFVNRTNAADILADYYLIVAKDGLSKIERSLQRPSKNEKEFCTKLEHLRKNGLYYRVFLQKCHKKVRKWLKMAKNDQKRPF